MTRDPESSVPPPKPEGGTAQGGTAQGGAEKSGVGRVRRHRYKTAPATPQSIIEELRRASQKKPPR